MKDNLPNKLSDLIEVALEDLEKVEKDKRYTVDMQFWHTPTDNFTGCSVCLAGAVIAKSLNVPIQELSSLDKFKISIRRKLVALDQVRDSKVGNAIRILKRDSVTVPLEYYSVPSYDEDRPGFKKALQAIAKELRKLGY